MIIAITLHESEAKVAPVTYLGKHFDKYRSVCEAAGATYDRQITANTIRLEAVPQLVEMLKKDGFDPRLHPELRAALTSRAGQIRGNVDAARARIELLQAALKRENKALFPFQIHGIEWMAPRLSGLLADDPGLGKTVQGLGVPEEAQPTVIVCPAVAKGVWVRHLIQLRPDLQPQVLSGRSSWRAPQRGEAVVLNYDILPAIEAFDDEGLEKKLSPFYDILPGTVFLGDEFHAAKNRKSLRGKRVAALIKTVLKSGGKAFGLTGSPLMNRQEELASLLTTLGLFQEAFGSWPRYLRVMNGQKARFGGYQWGKPSPAAIEGLRRVMLRRRREEVLKDLPTKIYETVDVELNSTAKAAVDKAAAILASLGISLEDSIKMASKATPEFGELSRIRKALASAKVSHLLDMIDEYEEQNEPVVVFSAHRPPIDALQGRPGWAVITGDTPTGERTKIEEMFQSGLLKGIAGTIDAMGVSITLTRAHQLLMVDRDPNPEMNRQAEDRICRIGQTKGCIIRDLVFAGTYDEDVIAMLRGKMQIIDATVNAAAVKDGETNRVDPAALERAAKAPTQGELL